jgi:aryl-alcohol dehydrogenase-like predicted oxidoreductase
VRSKSVTPLVGVNNVENAKELVGCLKFELSKEHVLELEEALKLKAIFDEDAVGVSPFR